MPKSPNQDVLAIQAIISDNLAALLGARDMTRADLAKASKTTPGLTKKTVYNVVGKKHPTQLDTLVKVSRLLGVPPWAMLLPNLSVHKELLTPGALKGLDGMLQSYLECDPRRRSRIESFARSMQDDKDLDR